MITNDKIQSCSYAHSTENKHTNITKWHTPNTRYDKKN